MRSLQQQIGTACSKRQWRSGIWKQQHVHIGSCVQDRHNCPVLCVQAHQQQLRGEEDALLCGVLLSLLLEEEQGPPRSAGPSFLLLPHAQPFSAR